MEKKIRILQIAPRLPFPMDDGGRIGIANILKEFSRQGADVTFFTFKNEEFDSNYIKEAEKYCKLFFVEHSTNNTFFRIIKSFISNKSLFLTKYQSKNVFKLLKELIGKYKFDIIHADHTSMAPLAFCVSSMIKKPVGIRLHNIEWTIWKRYSETFSYIHPQRFYLESQANLLKSAESKLIKKADVCFAITEPDKQRALDLSPNAKIVIASAGVNSEEWKPDRKVIRDPFQLILATSYRWIHNVDALKWFLNKCFPLIKKSIPQASLTLIGKDPPEWLQNYIELGVNVVGYVPKVQPYLNNASVYIAPLFVGGGIRIKILEAMSMELPVVATPIAAEGIKSTSDTGLFIEKNSTDFAERVIYLLKNAEFTRKAGNAARKHIIQEYSWEKNVGLMLDEYRKLIK